MRFRLDERQDPLAFPLLGLFLLSSTERLRHFLIRHLMDMNLRIRSKPLRVFLDSVDEILLL